MFQVCGARIKDDANASQEDNESRFHGFGFKEWSKSGLKKWAFIIFVLYGEPSKREEKEIINCDKRDHFYLIFGSSIRHYWELLESSMEARRTHFGCFHGLMLHFFTHAHF